MAHTYAVLDVPNTVYAAVRALLDAAGYQHAFHDGRDGEVIDMHGIALKSKSDVSGTSIEIGTLLSSRTKTGRVELQVNGEVTQMDLDKAREVHGMLSQAIEAAVSDEMLYRFLRDKVGLDEQKAGVALLDFRELRQGSRKTLYPS